MPWGDSAKNKSKAGEARPPARVTQVVQTRWQEPHSPPPPPSSTFSNLQENGSDYHWLLETI